MNSYILKARACSYDVWDRKALCWVADIDPGNPPYATLQGAARAMHHHQKMGRIDCDDHVCAMTVDAMARKYAPQ